MSRQWSMQARTGDESAKPEESAIVAVGGEPDMATASARVGDFSDDDLLALYREHARGSRGQTAGVCGAVPHRGDQAALSRQAMADPGNPATAGATARAA